jgi:hypothetical protein
MTPAAPGRFVTMTDWPQAASYLVARSRPSKSAPPPGGKATTSVTCLDGKFACAAAGAAAKRAKPATATDRIRYSRRFMLNILERETRKAPML